VEHKRRWCPEKKWKEKEGKERKLGLKAKTTTMKKREVRRPAK
jgi:hypothetical protein